MSARALLTKDDALRLTEAAKASGCLIEVRRGDVTITIRPDGDVDKKAGGSVSLAGWRDRHANKGQRRA